MFYHHFSYYSCTFFSPHYDSFLYTLSKEHCISRLGADFGLSILTQHRDTFNLKNNCIHVSHVLLIYINGNHRDDHAKRMHKFT